MRDCREPTKSPFISAFAFALPRFKLSGLLTGAMRCRWDASAWIAPFVRGKISATSLRVLSRPPNARKPHDVTAGLRGLRGADAHWAFPARGVEGQQSPPGQARPERAKFVEPARQLDSVLYCARPIPLLPDGGKIVLVSSTAGQRASPSTRYAATKGAVISFTKSLAVELAPRRINVNCGCAGWVIRRCRRRVCEGRGRGKGTSSGRSRSVAWRAPRTVAGPIVFLCSDWPGTLRARFERERGSVLADDRGIGSTSWKSGRC